MNNIMNFISETDFKLLKKQKLHLLDIIDLKDQVGEDQVDAIHGIVNMIDAFQDAVVADGIKTEKEVFNLSDE